MLKFSWPIFKKFPILNFTLRKSKFSLRDRNSSIQIIDKADVFARYAKIKDGTRT